MEGCHFPGSPEHQGRRGTPCPADPLQLPCFLGPFLIALPEMSPRPSHPSSASCSLGHPSLPRGSIGCSHTLSLLLAHEPHPLDQQGFTELPAHRTPARRRVGVDQAGKQSPGAPSQRARLCCFPSSVFCSVAQTRTQKSVNELLNVSKQIDLFDSQKLICLFYKVVSKYTKTSTSDKV